MQCGLEMRGLGTYLVSFKILDGDITPENSGPLSRLLPQRAKKQHSHSGDSPIQVQLLSATRLLEDLILAIDAICSTEPGHLSVALDDTAREPMIELIDGVKVLRRIYPSSWELLALPYVQDLLRRIAAPFQDPLLYTMSVQQVTQSGSLGANWVITANRHLCNFADGGRLEVPKL